MGFNKVYNSADEAIQGIEDNMTLMLGGNTKAVESNTVLDIVFSENPELLKEEFVFK